LAAKFGDVVTVRTPALCRCSRRSVPAARRSKASRGDGVHAVWFWLERSRQRRALAELDDYLLRDIGLTCDEVQRECANPFWKP
jgi:uncharacterized protein YjiS (DUF1127 family)